MEFSLSTNWNAGRFTDGAAIADEAAELGFNALELGYNTTPEQVPGFRSRLDSMPVRSVHAFCPVPVSAPHGYPELHLLASADEDERALAFIMVRKTIEFASSVGADVVVLHAGRVFLDAFLSHRSSAALREALVAEEDGVNSLRYRKLLAKAVARRRARGLKRLEIFRAEMEKLVPILEKNNISLAFENLPSIEGFPDEDETMALMDVFKGKPFGAWFDVGHAKIRENFGWTPSISDVVSRLSPCLLGAHIHDVKGLDSDHLAVGEGSVDFTSIRGLSAPGILKVFEPSCDVSADALRAGLESLRRLWPDDAQT